MSDDTADAPPMKEMVRGCARPSVTKPYNDVVASRKGVLAILRRRAVAGNAVRNQNNESVVHAENVTPKSRVVRISRIGPKCATLSYGA
jgi:hypothetical protein